MHKTTTACVLALLLTTPARAGLLGGNERISGWNCKFPDAAYSPQEDRYLVVWVDYTDVSLPFISGCLIRVEPAGLVPESTFAISNPAKRAFYPAVTYNPTAREFLVTWDHQEPGSNDHAIFGRRVQASNGTLSEIIFQVSTILNGQRSAAAWSATSQRYLVAYSTFADVYAQRIDTTGLQKIGSEFLVNDATGRGFYPAVDWSPATDQFLVAWGHNPPDDRDYVRRRLVPAAEGGQLGDLLTITSAGKEGSPTIARDDGLGRWLVQYNDWSIPAQSCDQYGRFIRDDGSLDGQPIPIANSPVFEGGTDLGSDIAFAPAAGVYFSSFVNNTGIAGRLLDRNGTKIRPQAVLGTYQSPGDFKRHNNAADTLRNQFLTVWEGNPEAADPTAIYAQLYAVCTPVSNLSAEAGPARLRLCWTNPNDSEMTHVMIRFSTSEPPAGPNDGTLLVDLAVTPGDTTCFVHLGLDRNRTYYYGVFAHDATPIYAPGVSASAQPLQPGDLDDDGDVDQSDFGQFQACFSGSGQSGDPGCSNADLMGDGDVDQDDFGVFQSCNGGPGNPPGC